MQQVVVITGASSGIGLATALYLLERGYRVYGISRNGQHDAFPIFHADVNDTETCRRLLAQIAAQAGGIDVFINNAGYGIAGPIEETDSEVLYRNIDTNLTAVIALSGAVMPYLKERKGRLINMASVAAVVPLPFQAVYCAAKAGMEIFSRALALEVKPFGVQVTAILPCDTKTGFTGSRILQQRENSAYAARLQHSVENMTKSEQSAKGPAHIARAIYRVIRKKHPPLRVGVGATAGLSGKFIIFLVRILPTKWVNRLVEWIYG